MLNFNKIASIMALVLVATLIVPSSSLLSFNSFQPAYASTPASIYAIGGQNSGGLLNTVENYNPVTNIWSAVAPMPTARSGIAAAVDPSGNIYVVGGQGSTGALNTVEKYNPGTNTWTTVAPMPTARQILASAVDPSGNIYVMGGLAGSTFLNTVEKYNPTTNTWTTVAPMPTATAEPAAAVDSSGNIYVIGGSNGPVLNTVQKYNPTTNTWTTVAPMSVPRGALAAALDSSGNIYAIGGNQNGPRLNIIEKYNPTTNTWTTVAPMPTGRSDIAAALDLSGNIYVMGGTPADFALAISTVEKYNPGTNTWTTVAPMSTSRAFLASVSSTSPTILSSTTTTLSSSANPSTFGQQVTFTATVSPSTATGTVTFTIDGTAQPSVTLSGGSASLISSSLLVGSHTITAAYSGDINDAASTSSALTQTVNKISFSSFTAKVYIEDNFTHFELKYKFTLGTGSPGINPVTDNMSLQVGTFSTTIPAGSFTQDDDGHYKFEGVINGVHIEAGIKSLGSNTFEFTADAEHANLAGTANPVPVQITIGNNFGTTTVTAKIDIEHDHNTEHHNSNE